MRKLYIIILALILIVGLYMYYRKEGYVTEDCSQYCHGVCVGQSKCYDDCYKDCLIPAPGYNPKH